MPEGLEPGVSQRQCAGVCTLFEGDFHLGLAAFLNSLVRAGYSGTVWAGYRGALPPWTGQLERSDAGEQEFRVTGQIRLVFLPVETEIHLTNYKPKFMLDLLAGPACGCEYLWYFDPDIFLRARWAFFDNWQRYGIALCQEIVDNNLPADSPLRHEWAEIASSIGFSNPRALNHYFNGGLVGVAAAHAGFLEMWRRLIERAAESGCDLSSFMPGNREMPFHASDQDALNVAAMYSEFPLSTLGPQGMGFVPGDVKMYHTVGQKPWRGSFLLRALAGNPPSNAMKCFLTQVSSPIRAYSSLGLGAKRIACFVAALIGRFYRRG
ncbi:MAG: hypothetical protein WBE56_01185 [Terracidiphilus sp.]